MEEKKMNDAMAIANYFIQKGIDRQEPITLLKLLKLVYLTHGFSLAAYDKSFLSKYDSVEAWKFGPVIPSIYHSFKHNGGKPIIERGIIVTNFENNGNADVVCPMPNEDFMSVLDFVWNRYGDRSASSLVDLLHMDNTPWAICYRANRNEVIPDILTKQYYTNMLNKLAEAGRKVKESNRDVE